MPGASSSVSAALDATRPVYGFVQTVRKAPFSLYYPGDRTDLANTIAIPATIAGMSERIYSPRKISNSRLPERKPRD
jgi:hypothetical protein